MRVEPENAVENQCLNGIVSHEIRRFWLPKTLPLLQNKPLPTRNVMDELEQSCQIGRSSTTAAVVFLLFQCQLLLVSRFASCRER